MLGRREKDIKIPKKDKAFVVPTWVAAVSLPTIPFLCILKILVQEQRKFSYPFK